MMLAFKLDERSRKVLLVLCALFIIILLIFGGIYYAISKYMKKQSRKMDTYMYDLIKYGIVKDKNDFKSAVLYHEPRLLFNTSKWPIRAMIIFTGIACLLAAFAFDKNFYGFFNEVFKLFPKIKWPTIKEINAAIDDPALKLSGPGWLPASIFPTFISKNPDFSSPLLYCSTIYYIIMLFCAFGLMKAVLAFIARVHRAKKMSVDVFQKDLDSLAGSDISTFANMVNSPIPNQNNYQNQPMNNYQNNQFMNQNMNNYQNNQFMNQNMNNNQNNQPINNEINNESIENNTYNNDESENN